MFNNSYNNNQNQAPSVNTKLATMYSDLSCLQLGLWNNNLSIKMNIAKGKNQDGIMQYDFDNRISTAIVPDRASDIYDYIVAEIMPEIEHAQDGLPIEPKVFGFDVGKGKTTRFAVEYVQDENGVPSAYVCLYTNMNPNGIPGGVVKYKFNKLEYVKGYDPKSGSAESMKTESEFLNFASMLKNLNKVSDVTYNQHGVKSYEQTAARFAAGSNSGSGFSQNSQPSYNAPVSSQSGDSDYPF